MTKIWKYRSDNGSCSSGGTVRYTPVRIWRGFWIFCHDAEPSSSWCFREYRYQRCSTRHMQALRWQIDWPYVLGFWRESLQCWSHCSWALCTSSQSAISACTSRVIPLRWNVTVPTHPYWQSNTKAAKHSLSFKAFAVFFRVVFLLFWQVSEDSCQSSAAASRFGNWSAGVVLILFNTYVNHCWGFMWFIAHVSKKLYIIDARHAPMRFRTRSLFRIPSLTADFQQFF